LLNLKRTAEAIESADKIIDLQPKEAFSWWFHSFILAATDKYQEALKSIDSAKKLEPKNADIWEMRGNIFGSLKNYSEALNSFNKAIKFGKKDFELIFKKSFTLLNLKRYELAIESCNEAMQIKADSWRILSMQAVAFLNLEKYEESLLTFEKAIQYKPNNFELWHDKGSVLAKMERYEEASASYDKALSLSPDDIKTLKAHSLVLIELEKYEEAIESVERVVKKSDDETKAWLSYTELLINKSRDYKNGIKITKNITFGTFQLKNKRYIKAAILILDKMIQANSNNHEAYFSRSVSQYEIKLIESALTDINQAIKLNEDILYISQRGLTLINLKRYQEALLDIEKVIELNPNISDFWEYKGDCLFYLKDYQAALESYNHALHLKKDDADLYLKCAKTEFKLENIKSAVVYLNKAIRLEPKNYQVWWLHGLAKAKLGKPKREILADLDKAVQFSPDKNFALIEKTKLLFKINYLEEAQIECNKAIQAYNEIIEKDETNADAFYNRACCYALLENATAAIADLKQAIQLDSDYANQAADDEDFEKIKDNSEFQALINPSEKTEIIAKEKGYEPKKKNLFLQTEKTLNPLLGFMPNVHNELNLNPIEKPSSNNSAYILHK
jgi:tetratricopeptide (TPR) repeat protein